jgi:hypothetical protein
MASGMNKPSNMVFLLLDSNHNDLIRFVDEDVPNAIGKRFVRVNSRYDDADI